MQYWIRFVIFFKKELDTEPVYNDKHINSKTAADG